ncbi:hypothetical protein CRUP_002570 [Coryphaenoides rupestris]|nr:hypothetical protein CRUP_002570 [Coryphaenoides rupestris]
MSGQTSNGGVGLSPPRSTQRTLLNDLAVTFSSPMAWLLAVALVITWSGVAIVLFDLLDYKTLTGAGRPVKSIGAKVAADATAQEDTDWLGLAWSFAANLVAPEDEGEEEAFHSEEF